MTFDLTPPPFINYAIPFFFLLMGIEMLYGVFAKKNFYNFSDTIADLSTGILSQISAVFLKLVTLIPYIYLYENYRVLDISMDSIPGWIFCIIGWDFFYYWLHRLSHEVNFFWASHVIHHHSEEYNLIVALRQTSLGGIFNWIFFLPLALIGFPPWMFLASGQLNLIYQYWVHTKAIKSIGTVGEFLLSTPSHHRVHHAINPEYIDKNHGGIFIIWDRIFGTFIKEDKEPVYGTVKPLKSFNPVWANFHYYLQILSESIHAEGFINKIKVWIKPPGWYPSTKESPEGFLPIPEVHPETFKKYNPRISSSVKKYVLVWFILVLFSSFAFLLFYQKLDFTSQVYSALWITMSLLSICALLESRRWGKYLEGARIALLIPLLLKLVL